MNRLITTALLTLALLPSQIAIAAAQASWPSKPLRIIVAWPPGGAADITCRHLQQPLAAALGQPVVIENKTGGGGLVGTEATVRSAPDGYTIGLVISSLASHPALNATMPYDAVKDVQPITIVTRAPNVLLVHPSSPLKSVADLVAAAKAAPGKLNYATSGNGTAQHLGFEHFKLSTGIDMVHVPYRGAGPALNDLVAGQVQIGILNIAGAMPHIQAGRLRALAVSGPKRSAMAPDVPSLADTVPGFDFTEWFALVGPAGIPEDVVAKLHAAIKTAAQDPGFVAKMKDVGLELDLDTPADFKALIAAEIKKMAELVKKANIKLD